MTGNIIKVTSIGEKSTISEKKMSQFANKTQKNKEFTLDKNVLAEICKALNLNNLLNPLFSKQKIKNMRYSIPQTKEKKFKFWKYTKKQKLK